jgi:hypothetical protein
VQLLLLVVSLGEFLLKFSLQFPAVPFESLLLVDMVFLHELLLYLLHQLAFGGEHFLLGLTSCLPLLPPKFLLDLPPALEKLLPVLLHQRHQSLQVVLVRLRLHTLQAFAFSQPQRRTETSQRL